MENFDREPTIGLHAHLEATMTPEIIARLAQKNGVVQVRTRTGEMVNGLDPQDPESVRDFFAKMAESGFAGPDAFKKFMAAYGLFTSLFKEPEDLTFATFEILKFLQSRGTLHQELRTSPMSYLTEMGMDGETLKRMDYQQIVAQVISIIMAIQDGIDKAREELDMSGAAIACFSRDKGVSDSDDPWENAMSDPLKIQGPFVANAVGRLNEEGNIIGLDIAGSPDYARFPLSRFRELIRDVNFEKIPITIHAGEAGPANNFTEAPAEEVRYAVENLNARRIGHGLSVMNTPEVKKFLKERRVVIESCPVSNEGMGLISLRHHPLGNFIEEGLPMCIDTDDAILFGTASIRDMLRTAGAKLGLTVNDVRSMNITAIQGAFLPEKKKETLMKKYRGRIAGIEGA